MEVVTTDLSKFGYMELEEASKLLLAYVKQGAENLGDGLTLNFNTSSGYVFLSDEDYNVYMLNENELKQFFNCAECGNEGFKEDFDKNSDCEYCKEIAN